MKILLAPLERFLKFPAMKKMMFLLVLIFSFVACSSNDGDIKINKEQLPVTVENLAGTWLSLESRTDFGTELSLFEPIELNNQYIFILSNALTIKDSRVVCVGNYELNENILEFIFECTGDSVWKVSSLTDNELILVKIYSQGLVVKFKKQNGSSSKIMGLAKR